MIRLSQVAGQLDQIAPLALAESWDNVGLLAGDHDMPVGRLMTCLTLTQGVLQEAMQKKVDLIVTHHPIPFKPIDRITTNSTTGRILWQAIGNSIAIYSPHTAWDNAPKGINRQLAHILKLGNLRPLEISSKPELASKELGTGIVGELAIPASIDQLWRLLADSIGELQPRCSESGERRVSRIGIVCGSGASLLPLASKHHCDVLVTGEATYHQVLEGQAIGMAIMLLGHFASERFAMRTLAKMLGESLPGIDCLSSESEVSDF